MAGGTAAATLREEGFDGRVVLIGAEPHPPYERPPLSKEVLRGEKLPLDTPIRPQDWWEEHEVETRFGRRAHRCDPAERCVTLADGEEIRFVNYLGSNVSLWSYRLRDGALQKRFERECHDTFGSATF